MQREWYEGINPEWIKCVCGYMQLTADMLEDAAKSYGIAEVPPVVEALHVEMDRGLTYLALMEQREKADVR